MNIRPWTTGTKNNEQILVEIAKSINDNIQFIWDTPIKNTSRRLPVLDLAIWVQVVEVEQKIMHTL